MAKIEEELNSLLMIVKEDSEKAGLKLNIHETKTTLWINYTSIKNLLEKKKKFTKVKEECEKAGLKLNFQKTKIMASGPITSWQIDGETMETVTILF